MLEYITIESKKPNKLKTTGNKKKDCFNVFEEYLFGEQFNEPETNTEKENRVWDILTEFSSGKWDTQNKPKEVIQAFELLKSCANYYDKLLTPKTDIAYRGVSVSHDKMLEITSKNIKDTKNIRIPSRDIEEVYVFDYEHEPSSYIQSWTTSLNIAFRFALSSRKAQYPIVIAAKIDNSFFGNPKLTKRVEEDLNLIDNLSEDEVYRVGGKIKCEVLVPDKMEKQIEERKNKLKKAGYL